MRTNGVLCRFRSWAARRLTDPLPDSLPCAGLPKSRLPERCLLEVAQEKSSPTLPKRLRVRLRYSEVLSQCARLRRRAALCLLTDLPVVTAERSERTSPLRAAPQNRGALVTARCHSLEVALQCLVGSTPSLSFALVSGHGIRVVRRLLCKSRPSTQLILVTGRIASAVILPHGVQLSWSTFSSKLLGKRRAAGC